MKPTIGYSPATASQGQGHPRYFNLRPIAEAADLDQRELVAASRRGDFAPVLRISQRVYLVRADDLAAWERKAMISPSTAQESGNRDCIEPAEPFAHLATTPPPPRHRRTCSHTHTSEPPSTVAASPEAGRG